MIYKIPNVIKTSEVQYITGDNTYLTDSEYDHLSSERQSSQEAILTYVPILDNTKFTISPFWMGGVNTFFEGDGRLMKWITKTEMDTFYITPKLDGASVMYWNDKEKMKLANRGQMQNVCQDITDMLQYMKMPHIPEGVVCRGELVTTKAFFDQVKADETYICHRNMISGIIRHFATNGYIERKYAELASYTVFVAFEFFIDNKVYGLHDVPSYISDMLEGTSNTQFEFAPVHVVEKSEITEQYMNMFNNTLRIQCKYPVDGTVIYINSDHVPNGKSNPNYCGAYKQTSNVDSAIIVVSEIKWGKGVTGQLTPTLHFDPVFLCDASITSVTAHNAKNMMINDIGIGSTIKIIRSGEIIPKIVEVVQATGFSMPDVECYWDQYATHLMCHVEDDEAIMTKMHHFTSEIGAKGIGPSTVKEFYRLGCCSIADMFTLTSDELRNLGPTKSISTVQILHSALQHASLVNIMVGSNCFPRGIGTERLNFVISKFPNLRFSGDNIKALHGFSDKTTSGIMEGMKSFWTFIEFSDVIAQRVNKLLDINTIILDDEEYIPSHYVTFTGFRDEALVKLLMLNKMKYKRNITNETTILVKATYETDNKTVARAMKMGIFVTDKEGFERMCNNYV